MLIKQFVFLKYKSQLSRIHTSINGDAANCGLQGCEYFYIRKVIKELVDLQAHYSQIIDSSYQ